MFIMGGHDAARATGPSLIQWSGFKIRNTKLARVMVKKKREDS